MSYIAGKLDHWFGDAAWIALGALLALLFVVAFVVSRFLIGRLTEGKREISAGFSASGASALLALTGGQLFLYAMLVFSFSFPLSDVRGILGAAILGIFLFLPLFSLAIPITILYFILVLRNKDVADGILIWIVAGFLLVVQAVYLYKLLEGGIE